MPSGLSPLNEDWLPERGCPARKPVLDQHGQAIREGVGRTALVTGASAGIGRAFAELLASRGYAVILSARRQDRLDALAAELRERHQVDTLVVVADLAEASAPAAIMAQVAARGLQVDVLVNNAGYGPSGRFDARPWSEHEAAVRVMVGAVCELSYRVLPGMRERRWGRIVNVASLIGFLPGSAGHPLYGSAKAFLIKFSEALAAGYKADGVYTTALCPGFTLTEFHDITGTRAQVSQLPSWMWTDAATVAEEGYAAVMRGRAVHVNGRVNRTLAWLARILPQGFLRRALARFARRVRRA